MKNIYQQQKHQYMKVLTQTNTSLLNISLLLLRCTVGLILFAAGAGKVFGWFGGFGLQATLGYYSTSGIPSFWAYVSSFTELIGGFLLIIGFLTRPAALALSINMLVAVIVTGTKGFFTGGAAYPFTLMICSLVILLTGPMAYSLDALFSRVKIIIPENTTRLVQQTASIK
jgi:putative oxidoreductase